ncbi:cytochrome P450 [Xylariomycetidae sp. FL0641]|nr:cytochrome P450 [Xylariomycetidae sp. FL0641]
MASFYLLTPAVLLGLLFFRFFTNWWRLRKAPGPVLAGCTDLWRAYMMYRGKLRQQLLDLHAKYGPVVRYGANSVSISDPEIIGAVYGARAGFITAESYKPLVGISNGKEVESLISTQDEARHGVLRRAVAGAFTPTAVLDYERWVDQTLAELLGVLGRRRRRRTLDLAATVMHYNVDAASRFSFGETLGCLAAGDDVGDSIALIRDRFRHWGRWSALPALERLVFRNPLSRRRRAPTASSRMAATAVAKLRRRTEGQETKKKKGADVDEEKGREDGEEDPAPPDLLQRFLAASGTHPKALDQPGIVGMLMSTISGAGDTTATTLTAAFWYLMTHPRAAAALEAELSAQAAALPPIPPFAQVAKLPYLHAVVRETMRLYPVAAFPMERIVPAGGVVAAGTRFPAGTSLGCLPAAVHLDPAVFGADAHVFRPERWIEAGPLELRRMDAAHIGFGRGRRNCLGQHIAMMQMKKAIPAVLMHAKLSLVDSNASLDADWSAAVAILHPLYVNVEVRE